ncbi:MAG: hypothetical protein Q9162_004865 [Coniocarpon cinnabarinum]
MSDQSKTTATNDGKASDNGASSSRHHGLPKIHAHILPASLESALGRTRVLNHKGTLDTSQDTSGAKEDYEKKVARDKEEDKNAERHHLSSHSSSTASAYICLASHDGQVSGFWQECLTELPADYVELETRVDALRSAHMKMLAVTSQYTNESYDYPPNLRESFNDLGRTIGEKVTLLSSASSPSEAQAAFTAPPSAKPQPKTFNHAIARAALASSQLLHTTNTGSTKEDPLAAALEKYAIAEEKVGEARLNQDAQIQSRFLAGWSTTLNTNLKFATQARKSVENARLSLDATKGKKMNQGGGEPGGEVEKKEDELVAQTEEAEGVMRNVLDTPEPLRNLSELIAAQMEYHKRAHEILSDLAPAVDQLQEEQEADYRKARGNA